MHPLKLLFLGLTICLFVTSCKREETQSDKIEITGTIYLQGITTYQYGTHIMAGYALRSSAINLDDYVNQHVTVVGSKIAGYPVEDGPDYLEVEEVK
jgi:hypothetical protein